MLPKLSRRSAGRHSEAAKLGTPFGTAFPDHITVTHASVWRMAVDGVRSDRVSLSLMSIRSMRLFAMV
jgi:hypothetical protein